MTTLNILYNYLEYLPRSKVIAIAAWCLAILIIGLSVFIAVLITNNSYRKNGSKYMIEEYRTKIEKVTREKVVLAAENKTLKKDNAKLLTFKNSVAAAFMTQEE